MRLIRAALQDFDDIIAFYDDVTAHTPDMALYARWSKCKHPKEESIQTYIEEGSMYLYREDGVIVGAMAVTMYLGKDYHAIEWVRQVGEDEIAVIHILAVMVYFIATCEVIHHNSVTFIPEIWNSPLLSII